MTAVLTRPDDAVLDDALQAALATVIDPELDEPITDLGFVRSVEVDDTRLEVHLRLPTSFCAPNFAYLMASDAMDALRPVAGARHLVVELDDHHDSDLINRGLAAAAGYRGTFGHEAEDSLDELRAIFTRKAHTAAMERAVTALLREDRTLTEDDAHHLVLADLPAGAATTEALLRRRAAVGLPLDAGAPVLVEADGSRPDPLAAAFFLRRARSVRISVDGNAHFCRGLLRTRYPGSEQDQTVRADDPDLDGGTGGRSLLPLVTPSNGEPS